VERAWPRRALPSLRALTLRICDYGSTSSPVCLAALAPLLTHLRARCTSKSSASSQLSGADVVSVVHGHGGGGGSGGDGGGGW
jgi:hypothetical protein